LLLLVTRRTVGVQLYEYIRSVFDKQFHQGNKWCFMYANIVIIIARYLYSYTVKSVSRVVDDCLGRDTVEEHTNNLINRIIHTVKLNNCVKTLARASEDLDTACAVLNSPIRNARQQ